MAHTSPILALLDTAAMHPLSEYALASVDGMTLSYAALSDLLRHNAQVLRSVGLGRGHRVATWLPNGLHASTSALSAMNAATCVPLNPGLRSNELRFALDNARVGALVMPTCAEAGIRQAAAECGVAVIEVDCTAASSVGPAALRWKATQSPSRPNYRGAGELALLLHTSGTTGRPKLVALTHDNLMAGAGHTARHLALSPEDTGLGVMPLFHTHGLVGSLLASLSAGACVVCTPGFDESRWLDWIERFEPTWYTASPTLHQAFLSLAARYRQRLPAHRFRVVRSTSSPLSPATLEALRKMTAAPVVEAYALTEAPGQVAATPYPPDGEYGGKVGRATGTTLGIHGPDGRPVAAGTPGEIVVSGDCVIAGYEVDGHVQPFPDGLLRTGDIGVLDETGCLTVLGRTRELVDRGGEKISPREVDDRLLEHPDIAEAASFAVSHPRLGEDLVAAVVPRGGKDLKAAEVHAFLSQRLADSKRPSQILVVQDIPKGPTGKIRRSALASEFAPLLTRGYVAPRGEVERELSDMWSTALGVPQVGIDDDFFSLGGDSLSGVSMLVAVEQRHGRLFRLASLFEAPTIREFAQLVEGHRVHQASTVVAVHPQGDRPPLFFMSGWGSQLMVFTAIARELGESRPLYALDPTALEVEGTDALTVQTVAARMIEDIRRLQPEGPYHLAGFSLGGKFVWEIAQQMRAGGQEVALLALLDVEGPGYPRRLPMPRRFLHQLRYVIKAGPRRGFAYGAEELRRKFGRFRRESPALFADSSLQASSLARAIETNSVALRWAAAGYTPGSYGGPITLIRAQEQPAQPGLDVSDRTMGWGALALGGVTVRELNCAHPDMLDAPLAPALANILSDAMAALESPTLTTWAEATARLSGML